jgi:hypothetical protein
MTSSASAGPSQQGHCAQELCANWSGDGRVCPCVLLDLEGDERPIADLDREEGWL